MNYLLATPNALDKARFLAVSASHSSDWLHVLPIASRGLRLANKDVRVAVRLRLGTALCKPHQCVCGAMVEANGLHELSCKLGSVRHARHTINDLIARMLLRAEVPCMKKPAGLSRSDGKRPNRLSLIPWKAGKSAVWDVIVTNTVAPTCVNIASQEAEKVAELASARKEVKYVDLSQNHIFVLIAIESLRSICSDGLAFLRDLGQRILSQGTTEYCSSYCSVFPSRNKILIIPCSRLVCRHGK